MCEDLSQDHGQVPVNDFSPLMDLERATTILRYDPVMDPPIFIRKDLMQNTEDASSKKQSAWPTLKHNDFITIVGWRYLRDVCQRELVVRLMMVHCAPVI
jgi:hypothetical protein